MRGGAWLALAAVAWCARAGPGPPERAPAGPPPWGFEHALYNLSIPENSAPRTAARAPPDQTPPWLPLPAAGARVRVRLRLADKDKQLKAEDKLFKAEERVVGDRVFITVRTRAGHADPLNRERRDRYQLELRVTAALPSGARLEAATAIELLVDDVNDLSPLFYPTEYDVLIPEDTPPHASVARAIAEDADLGLNGEIYYSFLESTDQFAVHPTTGVVTLTRPLEYERAARHELTLLAHDRASLLARGGAAPAARAPLVVRVARANLHAPELNARAVPVLVDEAEGTVVAVVRAADRDQGPAGRVDSLQLVDGDPDGHFRVRRSAALDEWDLLVHALLSRDVPRHYNLTLRARDAGTPPRTSYLTLPVTVAARTPDAPVFSRQVYEARVSETAPPRTPLVRLKVTHRDAAADARVYIEIVGGNEGGEFTVNPESGVLYTAVPLDAESKALYTLTVAAVDQGGAGARDQSSAKVKITVVDANDNDPVFEHDELEVTVRENGPAGVEVARVVARDRDSGENAYISYSIANILPVPFEVDHFSGAVRTTRSLDFESMRREYLVRIRAADWGLPYRRQAELRLRVTVVDVNDNRPQFERTDCAGPVPRRLSPGSELTTLSAIDFDAGDVVSYRIVGGNEDNYFSLDSGTGVLSLVCDLRDSRADVRVINVTATDGTHFADATSLVLRLTDGAGEVALECRDAGVARRLRELLAAAERSNAPPDSTEEFPDTPEHYGENLHAPDFVEFPVEVKVNESVALGTRLVTLSARDRDHGYNGILVYAISSGDDDSAFRIDPETGELTVIGYLDREREAEYFLNVTVADLGKPSRSSSRLLPVTVLDVNDNSPQFDQTLASFRVTENALNGTVIFQAHATDRDEGEFARITYSVRGVDAGEFCIEPETGALRVCAPLDRERRARYELAVRAVDGGGRASEARVRVDVDDVNDNAPQFAAGAGGALSARVREDTPPGAVLAVVEARDADEGAAARVRYSLPEQPLDDQVFTIDETSGVLRTAKWLDYEERQVYGVTVRATDGGQPALYGEVTLIVEVLDVDENVHAPQFAEPVLAGSVREDVARGTLVLVAAARDADAPGRDSRLHYFITGGSGMGYFSIDDTGAIHTLAPLDRETTPHYWLTACAEDHGVAPKYSCVQVYIEVEDVNDVSPWFPAPLVTASLPARATSGALVATLRASDGDAAPRPANLTYRIAAGNPDGLFSIDEHTGEVRTTGRALPRAGGVSGAGGAEGAVAELEVRASDGRLAGECRLRVMRAPGNWHAPLFTQRLYQLKVPYQDDGVMADEGGESDSDSSDSSTEGEGEAEDEDEARGWETDDRAEPLGLYVGTVLALDEDAGAAGELRYSWRGRGRGRALRVHAVSGRLYVAAPPTHHEITVRACDGGSPARCGVARVSARGVPAGGGGAPRVPAQPALAAAELDAPGYLLALLPATDPDNDTLYYDIVDGDEEGAFVVGREDGALRVARRLVWERRPRYQLNVSVSDGRNTVYTPVTVNVVNDVNEGGLAFTQELYEVEVPEDAPVGTALLTVRAEPGRGPAGVVPAGVASESGNVPTGVEAEGNLPGTRVLYGLLASRAPPDLARFRLDELTGVLELAQPLDRQSAGVHELSVWARDTAPRASRAYCRVAVRVRGVDSAPPAWSRRLAAARLPRRAPPGTLLATLRATDLDRDPLSYSLAGVGADLFSIHPTLGEVRLVRDLPDGADAPKEYTLQVTAEGPPPASRRATLPLHVQLVEPDNAPPTFVEPSVVSELAENSPPGTVVAQLETRSPSAPRYELIAVTGRAAEGLAGDDVREGNDTITGLESRERDGCADGLALFRVDPAGGTVRTSSPLDYEACAFYNLTIEATNMGGGSGRATVEVQVGDVNEFPPRLVRREYRGAVSEGAAAGAAVLAEDGAPLVLDVHDADGGAQRRRRFVVAPHDAAAAFRVDPVTGALYTQHQLDYETQQEYEFDVMVEDMGTPRLAGGSTARVTVRVLDVNDVAPTWERAELTARVWRPSVRGVLAAVLSARDADTPSSALVYDVVEGGTEALSLTPDGRLLVEKPDELQDDYRLRVRVSDGQFATTAWVNVQVLTPEPTGLTFQKSEYLAATAENATRPTVVAALSVLGAALHEHVAYSILNPTAGFQIGETSGVVTAGGDGVPLDREQSGRHELQVLAAAGTRRALARLLVTVTDVNDNCPRFVHLPYVAAVRAGAPAGTELLQLRAIDLDEGDNGEVRYEMKRGHGELFRVERRSGRVLLRQTLDAQRDLYSLVVAAFDGGVPACAAETSVTVRVWAGGTAPSWPTARVELTAREDVAPGTALGPPLQAASPLQRQLIYTLLRPADTPELELRFDTAYNGGNNPCVLVAAAPLDHESRPQLSATVRATDGVTGAYADLEVALRVSDVNDNAPRFERALYRATVSESAEPGTLLLTVKAHDNDSDANGEVEYSVWGGGELTTLVSVGRLSGEVRLAARLDAERAASVPLTLRASDRGTPPRHATAHLIIDVEDVNDNAPQFSREGFSGAVPVSLEAARGTALAALAARDADRSDAPRLRFSLEDDLGGAFSLHARTGLLTLASPRAWARAVSQRRLALNVTVSDGARAARRRVRLAPAGGNAHAPHFPHALHEARVAENMPPPVLLTTVKAYDEDMGEYGTITYSIPSAKLRETFSIDAVTGALSTRVPLDREARASWMVGVVARDGGGLPRHSAVRVRVVDENDHAPAFPLAEYVACVNHARAPRDPFITLTAYDADAGDNARLTYSIYEPDEEGKSNAHDLFHVDSASGAVSFAKNASEFAGRTLSTWVRATDGGGRAGEAPLQVLVARACLVPPLAAPPDLFLPEDAPPGTLLASLAGVAAPSAHQPKYRLAAGAARGLFAVDATGRLLLAGTLDRETDALHTIGVIAQYGEAAMAAARLMVVRVHVLDVNEHAPQFHSAPYRALLAENAPVGTSVLQVVAEDLDSGANGEVVYGVPESEEAGPFALEPSGWLVVAAPLDRERAADHRVPLQARDAAPPARRRSTRGSALIRLVDYNDCPPRFSEEVYRAEVREDAPIGTVVLRVSAADADLAPPTAYWLVGGGGDGGDGELQLRASGELVVAAPLDRERASELRLSVLASDGKYSHRAAVVVTVLDANDNGPVCERDRYSVSVRENVGGVELVRVMATDADEGEHARARYWLEGEGAEQFEMQRDSGRLRLASPLDRERAALLRLVAHVQDREHPEWECTSEIEVIVEDENDNAPTFSAARYSVTLPEDAEVGSLVVKVHAADPDLGANRIVLYSLLDDAGVLALEPSSGIVTLRAPLDREATALHRGVLLATDGGVPPRSATAELLLTVADVNDNPPEFERRRYSAEVPELQAPGAAVLRVHALNADSGVNGEVHYALVGGESREDFALDADSGVLRVARPLDYERVPRYSLRVQAVDGGSPPLSDFADVDVEVVDCNDNAPQFTQATYVARVREDAALGAVVLQLIALDADAGANGRVQYRLARAGPFALDAATGLLTVAGPLDRETAPLHVLAARARDGGEPALEGTAAVRIEVLDVNDNAPQFVRGANLTAAVAEGRAPGLALLRLEVTDADAPPNAAPFTFDFQSGNEMGAFRLEQDGVLRTAARFNHRVKDLYVLQIRVFDNGSPPLYSDAWVRVRVTEQSRYPPAAAPLDVVAVLRGPLPPGPLGAVAATDRDLHDVLQWALAPPLPPPDLFMLDTATGELRASALEPGEYRLNVTVTDGRFTTAAPVRVLVLDVTDEVLAHAVVVRFREVSAESFLLSHRRGFVRAVSEAAECAPADVLLLSVQPSGDAANELEGAGREKGDNVDVEVRRRRQVAQDLDVLFAARAPGGAGALVPSEVLRRRLHTHLERLEERARLVVEELVRAPCPGCARAACRERAELRGPPRLVNTELFALVAPAHRLVATCVGTGASTVGDGVVTLGGDGYLQYSVAGGVEGSRVPEDVVEVSLRFRSMAGGTLVWAGGAEDALELRLAAGSLEARLTLGAGAARLALGAGLADGEWHAVRVWRRGAALRVWLDGHEARALAPPPAALLDLPAPLLTVGARLEPHEHADAPLQVTEGFIGCITDLRLGAMPLPLHEGDEVSGAEVEVGEGEVEGGHARLVRSARAPVSARCPPLPPPDACSSHPCLNGGTCSVTTEDPGWRCACHVRFSGATCQVDSAPCAARPCRHGECRPAAAPPGYTCSCRAPATGPRCTLNYYCADPQACGGRGWCEEGVEGASCRCRGYRGPRCQLDVDECVGEPCAEGATCLNEPGSFRCVCPPHRTGAHCGNPLHSGAVLAQQKPTLWRWLRAAPWPLWAGVAAAAVALIALALLPLCRRRRADPPPKPPPLDPTDLKPPQKLSNLERARPAPSPPPLNNADTLRSYGSAGDELEGIPPDYRRNLNLEPALVDRKPWSEQMHLHTFTDNKIYNDLKGTNLKAARPRLPPVVGGAGGTDVSLVGGYHWDCSDWCGGGGALPAITEVAAGERRDSTSPGEEHPPAPLGPLSAPLRPPPEYDTSSGLDDEENRYDFAEAESYLVHPDTYLPRAGSPPAAASSNRDSLRALRLREPDAASLITMLEERDCLLGGGGGSLSDVSARLCEIEDSDAESEGGGGAGSGARGGATCRHTDV